MVDETHWYRAFGVVKWVQPSFGLVSEEPTADVTVFFDAHKILRTTPAGVWILDKSNDKERWCGRANKKRWACPTKAEALVSLMARNQRRVTILTGQLRKARAIRYGLVNGHKEEHLKEGMYQL